MQRRGKGGSQAGVPAPSSAGTKEDVPAAPASQTPALRAPRHGGWKGFKGGGREAKMLRGEPGYHLGLFRIGYGMLLVQRTLAFMSSGAVDASFGRGEGPPTTPGGAATPPASVLNFGHGFLLLGGDLGSPTADAVRSACWCLCAAGAAISVGFRPNAVAFAASLMQLCLLLLEKSVYTDEAYLFALLGLLLSCTDCGKTLGLDAPIPEEADGGSGSGGGRGAALRDQPSDTVPHWHTVLLRFQVFVVHMYRGFAKATTLDWLLGGQPLLHTLEAMPPTQLARRAVEWAVSSDIPGLGGGDLKTLAVRANASMIFLDLFLGASLLASPHYRPVGLVLQTAIHLAGATLGGSDGRTWHLLIAATGVLFLDPASLRDNIERAQAWLQPAVSYDAGGGRYSSTAAARRGRRGAGGGARGGRRPYGSDRSSSVSGGGSGNGRSDSDSAASAANGVGAREGEGGGGGGGSGEGSARPKKKLPLQPRPSSPTVALISLYVLMQALVPLRHVLGDFPVEWSREGHEFSWRGGGGSGGSGGSGGLVREEGLVRVTHRPRGKSGGGTAAAAAAVQMVHLYGAPLTAQQVFRLVLDPDMLLQLAKKSAVTTPPPGGGRGKGQGGRGGRGTQGKAAPSPYSHVDAWKSINGRPFARWTDPTVDVWDARFEGEGPPNSEWLEMPPMQAELARAAGVMEAVRAKWSMKGQRVTFFAGHPGQAGLSNVFLGAYDPSNFNTTELCSVPAPPNAEANAARGSAVEGGGVLLGVAMGEVQLLTEPNAGGKREPDSSVLRVANGTVLAPAGRGHSVRAGASPKQRAGGLAIWYYVHACPDGMFHLCIGFLSGAGWEQLYPSHLGSRKSWTMKHGVPK